MFSIFNPFNIEKVKLDSVDGLNIRPTENIMSNQNYIYIYLYLYIIYFFSSHESKNVDNMQHPQMLLLSGRKARLQGPYFLPPQCSTATVSAVRLPISVCVSLW